MRILLGGIEENDCEVRAALPDGCIAMFAMTVDELWESIHTCAPDILIVDSALPGIAALLERINRMMPLPALVITSSDTEPQMSELDLINLFGYLPRPALAQALTPALQIAHNQFQRIATLQADLDKLREAFAARKIIDRAKGLVMQQQTVSENEAYAYLREESRRHRVPIVEVAKLILHEAESPVGNRAGTETALPRVRRIATSPMGRPIQD